MGKYPSAFFLAKFPAVSYLHSVQMRPLAGEERFTEKLYILSKPNGIERGKK